MTPPRRLLTSQDRETISRGVAEGLQGKRIAARIGRCPSVVSREISRHGGRASYRAVAADSRAAHARKRPKLRRLDTDPWLRDLLLAGLRRGWSPQQIAGRLRRQHPGDHTVRVSHETIYTWLYALPVRELKHLAETQIRLRSGRTRRTPATGRRPRQARITGMRLIDQRPAEAEGRRVPGHWEGDLIIGKDGKSAAATLVERVSRFTILIGLPARDSATVAEQIIDTVTDLPDLVRKSLTWDQGTELAQHAAITLATNLPIFFAHPHSPWERGTNEHTNRWIREYLPRGTNITHDQTYLDAIAAELNNRPRAILDYQKPSEVFAEMLNSGIAPTP
jgi:transposase, IS30 family